MTKDVVIIGAGLAGSECAWQLARRHIPVKLIDMKPENYSQAHHSPLFAELVCSNSLRSNELSNAVGLLKEEMRRMDSLIMESADATKVPAGGALAVDRDGFSGFITDALRSHPLCTVVEQEVTEIPEEGINQLFTLVTCSYELGHDSRTLLECCEVWPDGTPVERAEVEEMELPDWAEQLRVSTDNMLQKAREEEKTREEEKAREEEKTREEEKKNTEGP